MVIFAIMKAAGNKKIGWERLGLSLTMLCGVHCLLTPVAFTVLPLASASFYISPVLEWALIIPGLFISGYILMQDYQKKHGQKLPLILFAFASALLLGGHYFGHDHDAESLMMYLTPFSAVVLLVAYIINWRTNRHYGSCQSH